MAPAVIFDLHDWPAGDEQAGEIHRFLKNAAAVVAKVEHDAVDFLFVESLKQNAAVAGAFVVKAGKLDDAELLAFAVTLTFDDVAFGELVLELHDVACDANDFTFIGAGGDDGEFHDGSFFAANEGHNFIELHVQNIGGLLVAGVLHSDDAVIGFDEFAAVGGATGHDADDLGVTVICLEYGSNAGELHVDTVDFEILGFVWAHIIRVRIVGAG